MIAAKRISNSEMNLERTRVFPAVMLLLSVVLGGGCSSVGPRTVDRDMFGYVMAISESWKRQTLVNLLKSRYMDAPVFMDVSSVINSYTMEGKVDLGFSWGASNFQSVDGTGTYSDRPTITYSPLLGEDFTASLLRPIPTSGILIILQSGYPADFVLRVCTGSINGITNRMSGLTPREADPRFYELLQLFRRVQSMNGLEIRVKLIDDVERIVMIVRKPQGKGEAEAFNGLLSILDLDPEVGEYPVIFGNFPAKENEITIMSRSMLQVMVEYALCIDVPETDISDRRAHSIS